MDIILWRHAEAEDGVPGRIPDSARALTPHGIKQARKMADWLLARLPDDCRILVSPAVRTQQTAAALNLPFITTPKVGTSANAETVLAAAEWRGNGANAGTVLVVGHQPTIGEVASLLLTGDDTGMSVKKGAVLWIAGRPDGVSLRAALTPSLA